MEDGTDVIIKTAREVEPLFKKGLEARTGGRVTISHVGYIAISDKKDPYESTYGPADDKGCRDVNFRYTHTIVFHLVFEGILEVNGRRFRFRQILKNYVSVREVTGSYRSCPWDVGYASATEYQGDKEFPLDHEQMDELIVSIASSRPQKRPRCT